MSETGFKPHPWFAKMWIREAERSEDRGAAEHRREMLAGLSGRVLELGVGSGTNFAHYPAEVTEVIAVEPEPTLRKAAEQAAAAAPVPVRVVDGIADRLPAEDESVDAAVASLVLCSVPDQAVALTELRRVIRPGGELRFYEHVQATTQPMASLLKFAEKTFWPIVGAGCHPARHTGAAIERAGFEMAECRRFRFTSGFPTPAVPHIIGSARRP
jgi:ubiquinone/menaquinone biosynthesis C-methylase UbiE